MTEPRAASTESEPYNEHPLYRTAMKRLAEGDEAGGGIMKEVAGAYLVQRITKQDKLIGPVHITAAAEKTYCGRDLDRHWWISAYAPVDEILKEATCKRCIEAMDDLKETEE